MRFCNTAVLTAYNLSIIDVMTDAIRINGNKCENIAAELGRLLPKNAEIVVLAIGSDRVTGDCTGPIAGHILAERGVRVYGSLASPVTAVNVVRSYEEIKRRHPRAFVIAVDSAVGTDSEVGAVIVIPRGLRPAAAVGKSLPPVGDIGIVGVVSPQRLGADALGKVRLALAYSLAGRIADGISFALMRRDKRLSDRALTR